MEFYGITVIIISDVYVYVCAYIKHYAVYLRLHTALHVNYISIKAGRKRQHKYVLNT